MVDTKKCGNSAGSEGVVLSLSVVAAKRGFAQRPLSTVQLARSFEVSPPIRLLPLASRLDGFRLERDGFPFNNSWRFSERDVTLIRQHFHGKLEVAVGALSPLLVSVLSAFYQMNRSCWRLTSLARR